MSICVRQYNGTRTGALSFKEAFQVDMDAATLDDIKERAKDMWLQPDRARTSYSDHYKERVLDVNDITTPRPTSAHRRNKPHPPNVFLTTRLHHVPGYGRLHDIPGYHNPDTTLGKEPYKLDRSLPHSEQAYRNALKSKYIGGPSSAAVNQYKSIPELQAIKDPIKRQSTEAFLKLANEEDKNYVLSSLQEKLRTEDPYCTEESGKPYEYRSIASLHRYPRSAGAREAQHIRSIYDHQQGHKVNPTVASMRRNDIDNYRTVHFRSGPSKRGDFCIHPEWTPQMSHHRLNGLCKLDTPYLPGRR